MEGECTSSNALEMTEKYWTQIKVKHEFIDESTNSWPNVKEESVLQLDEEIKTEDEYFEAHVDALLEASCNQTTFKNIELKEEAIELKWKTSEPTLHKVKHEFIDESTNSWPNVKKESVLQLDTEIKTEDEYFEAHVVDALLETSCNQTTFENIELKEEAIELKWKTSEPTLHKTPKSTVEKKFIRKRNLLIDKRNSELDDVFHEQEVLNFDLESKSFKCITVDRSFCCNRSLNVHKKSDHEKFKPFKCSNCDYSCGQKGHLSIHIKSVHEKLKPFKCPNCDYSCGQKCSLSYHIKSVHEILKPFKCSSCDYSFGRKGTLSRHIKSVHEKLKPLKCPTCAYSCSLKYNLYVHIKSVHEKLKPFKCPHCDYSSSRKGSLSLHIKSVHEKLEPFKCPTCDYSCSLKQHMMSVHEKLKPFKCPHCDYSSSNKGSLSLHIKLVHEKLES